MWVARFKVWHKSCQIRPLCKKHDVTDFVYVLKNWKLRGRFYYVQYHILQGKEIDLKKFVYDFRKIHGVLKLEYRANCMLTLREESIRKSFDPIFNPHIIQVKPVVQRTDGFEDWELASWNKKELMHILKVPIYSVKLTFIERRKMTDIILPHLSPELTSKQRAAIHLAVRHGYYNFPRKIDLVHLSRIAGVSRPAFQERLRKAEKKIIPFITDSIN